MGRQDEDKTIKVVCLGETMLMFAPSDRELIEHSDQFTAYIGGSEANVAIGLERLGMRAGWIGKLPRNALGDKIVNGIRAYGVDTSACIWTDFGRVGLFFVEWGAHPRPTRTIYDRTGSAASTLTADDLDWGYIGRAAWLHLTGITPALSETCRNSTPLIVARARELGCKVSFDFNYRSLLWSADDARAACQEILPHVDLLIATEADAALLLDEPMARDAMLQGLSDTYGPEAVVITCGDDGSLAYDGRRVYHAPAHQVQTINRLGAGDAFAAGLLYGTLTSDLQAGLDYGSAMAALKMTIGQNMPLINPEDVENLLSGQKRGLIR